jgi:hypothetical protein
MKTKSDKTPFTFQVCKTTYAMSYMLGFILILVFSPLDSSACGKKDKQEIMGFSFLKKISGQWEGPVESNTPAGDFDAWYVDFRPVSSSQVSQYSQMDANTINYTSFFVVEHNDQLKIAMRTEGVFMNKGCVTYEVMDSVDEDAGYYRFADFRAGKKRAFTEFVFKEDKLTMQTFTNVFNKQKETSLHTRWKAELAGRGAAKKAIRHFDFPKAIAVKNFTDAFKNKTESIYFDFKYDPYPSSDQPYVSNVTVDIAVSDTLEIKENHEFFVVLSTKPLFDGLKYKKDRLKYFSKYAYLPSDTANIMFSNVHPGTYYLYSYVDVDGDKRHKEGDYMSSRLNHEIVVLPESDTEVKTKIDYIIP